MRDGLKQMKKALGPDGYKKGEPYDFGSLTQDGVNTKKSATARRDRIYPNSPLLNVPAPNDSATPEQMTSLEQEQKQYLAEEANAINTIGNVSVRYCNTCDVGRCEDGSPLKMCKGCQAAKYCSKGCLEKDWKEGGHKNACKLIQKCSQSKGGLFFIGTRVLDPEWKNRLLEPFEKAMRSG